MRRSARRATYLIPLVLVLVLGSAATYAGFAGSTNSSGNDFAAGTVRIGTNDGGANLLALTSAQPGATDAGCILVTYTGSLAAGVRIRATATGLLAPYLTVTVTRGTDGTPGFDGCTGFVADPADYLGAGAGVVYQGTLAALPATWSAAPADPPTGAVESWTSGEAHSYRLSVSLVNDTAAQGKSATASIFWEARNQ